MTSEWIGWANIITTDKEIGDALGRKMNPDPASTEEFTTELRRVSDERPAWFTAVPMKQLGLDMLAEFDGPGPYTLLALIGVTPAEVAAGKGALLIEHGQRADYEVNGLAFIADQGYEIIPRT